MANQYSLYSDDVEVAAPNDTTPKWSNRCVIAAVLGTAASVGAVSLVCQHLPDSRQTTLQLDATYTPPFNESLALNSKQGYAAGSRSNALTAYWDLGACGPAGDDHNNAWCGGVHTAPNCPQHKAVSKSLCPTGWAELESVAGNGHCCSDVQINGCNYAYFAQYRCTQVVRDDRLTAYWDAGACGPAGDDHNAGWCGGTQAPNCPSNKAVSKSICPSGWAKLATIAGNGHCCSDVNINGCNYAWFAQYECQE